MDELILHEGLNADEALLNITYDGSNGDLTDPIPYDATNEEIKEWASEAIRNGDIAGISAHLDVDFEDFIVDRFNATNEMPNRLFLRPKCPFGFDFQLIFSYNVWRIEK